ncbi:hypothetical protein [Mycobacterium sp. ZZG]
MIEPQEGDDDMFMAFCEATMGGDPGHLGDDEPEVRPLCTECVRDLPNPGDSVCAFCRVTGAGQ